MLGLLGDKSDLVLVERYLKEWFFQSMMKRSDRDKKSRLAKEGWADSFGTGFGAMVGMMIERKVPGAKEMAQKYLKLESWNKAHDEWAAAYLKELEAETKKKELDAYDKFPNAKKLKIKLAAPKVKKHSPVGACANFIAMVTYMSDDPFIAPFLKGYPDRKLGTKFRAVMLRDLAANLKINSYDKLMKQKIDHETCKAQIGIKGKCAAKADRPIEFIIIGVDSMNLDVSKK